MLFERSFEKWKPQLKPAAHGLWLGRGYAGP
jgi:hypothetical protein